jgi:hypothetical protein
MSHNGRIARLFIWIPLLTLGPAAGALVFNNPGVSIGLASGGILMILNLLATRNTARQITMGHFPGQMVAVCIQCGKLGLTGLAIYFLLGWELVSAAALLAGLLSLPAALLFDILIFPVNKEGAKKN